MRVLQVHTQYRQTGGEDAVVADEKLLLEHGGHTVSQLIFANPSRAIGSASLLLRSAWNQTGRQALVAEFERFRPDVVHFHNNWFNPGPAILRALDGRGARQVLTLHNYRLLCVNAMLYRDGEPCTLCVGSSLWPGVVHKCYRASHVSSGVAAATTSLHRRWETWSGHIDRFIALTEFARSIHIEGGLPSDLISVRPNFVNDPGPRPQRPGSSDIVLYAGRVSEEKGLRTVFDAWASHPPAGLRLVVAGDGPGLKPLEARAPAGVEFLGHLSRPELDELMFQSRALVLPSNWFEGQPRVLLEAMAHGLPVMVSRLGGLLDTTGPAGEEMSVDPGDVPGWATALNRLIDDDLVDHLGSEARSWYDTHFTSAHALASLEAIYRAILDKP